MSTRRRDHSLTDDSTTTPPSPEAARKWIGIEFDCCDVYYRIYQNAAGSAYEGHCPRCAKPVRIAIGPGGTHTRFFRAT